MIENIIVFVMTFLMAGAILFGLFVFIKTRRQVPIVNKDVKSNIIEIKDSVNPKITEALTKGLFERLEKEKEREKLVQVEKETLLKDDYIYEKIKNTVSENEDYFIMYSDDNEITRDAINLIPGMKACGNNYGNLFITFPNRE
jgi:hypothetical protein